MGWRMDFVDLEDGSLIMIALGGFPGTSAEEIGIIKSCVVIAPVAHVLDRACSRDCGFEAGGLRDEPIGHVAAVAVAANGETIRISDAVFQQRVNAFENVLAGTRDDEGNDLHEELISVSAGTAVVGLEDEPSVSGGERSPLVPVGFEVVAVGIGGATMDEREHRQMLGFKLSRRINQHAFHGCSIVSLPAIRLALRQIALAEKLVERSDRPRLLKLGGALREIHFNRLAQR